MLIKLDLSKSFDKFNCKYIYSGLRVFGFHIDWVKWILSLIFYAFFSILINGSHYSPFIPSRGIFQGDPLSPFIFILMDEGLGKTLKASINSRKLHGLNMYDFYISISHNQFVDHTMLMGILIAQETRAIKNVLEDLMDASGMSISSPKSYFLRPLWKSNSMSPTFWYFLRAPFHPNI